MKKIINITEYIQFATHNAAVCIPPPISHADPNTRIFVSQIHVCNKTPRGTAVAQWLRCCATNRKVAGSIPVGVIGIFH